jgi:hypothetical protein
MKAIENAQITQELVNGIIQKGFRLSTAKALEVFGRKGDWHTVYYAPMVSSLEVWEMDSNFYSDLCRNLPNATVKITDSFSEVRYTTSKWDFIVIDNPQGVFGEGQYCEHFELFPHLFRIVKPSSVIVININLEPYDLHKNPSWLQRRQRFYLRARSEKLLPEEAARHYYRLCAENGFRVDWHFFIPRNSFISYLAFGISRIAKTPG